MPSDGCVAYRLPSLLGFHGSSCVASGVISLFEAGENIFCRSFKNFITLRPALQAQLFNASKKCLIRDLPTENTVPLLPVRLLVRKDSRSRSKSLSRIPVDNATTTKKAVRKCGDDSRAKAPHLDSPHLASPHLLHWP